MGKWFCKACYYTHHGEEAPDECPLCGAPKSQFCQKKPRESNLTGIILFFMILLLLLLSVFA